MAAFFIAVIVAPFAVCHITPVCSARRTVETVPPRCCCRNWARYRLLSGKYILIRLRWWSIHHLQPTTPNKNIIVKLNFFGIVFGGIILVCLLNGGLLPFIRFVGCIIFIGYMLSLVPLLFKPKANKSEAKSKSNMPTDVAAKLARRNKT